jgi:hypothetical protein
MFFVAFCAWMTVLITLGEIRRRLKELAEKVDRLERGLTTSRACD